MGHGLLMEDDGPVERAWDLELNGMRRNIRSMLTRKSMMKKENDKEGSNEEDAHDRKT